MTLKKTLLALITILTLSGTALADINYAVSSITNPPTIYTGDSTTVSFTITNNNYLYDGMCKYKLDSGSWSSEFPVTTSQPQSKSISILAPPEGSGTASALHTVTTSCYEPAYGGSTTPVEKYPSFTLNYDDSRYLARTAIASAQSAISPAQTSINNAQNAINDAKNLGADVAPEESKLSNARNSFQTAQSKLSTANSFNVHPTYGTAKTTADEAKSYATSAKSDAESVYSTAYKKYIDTLDLKNKAQTATTDAKTAIDSASALKTDAQNAINDAKNIGADIGSAQTLLDTAISKLNSATSKYNEANSHFNNKKWADAKTTADEAKTYANDALTNAGNAKSTAIQAKDAKIKADELAKKQATEKAEADKNEQIQTKSKLDSAEANYNIIVDNVDKTKDGISILSIIGIETSGFSKDMEKISSTLIDAKAELDKAKTRYDAREFSVSRTYSEKSLDITEKDGTILKDIQTRMAQAAVDKFKDKYSAATSNYEAVAKTLEESKANITADVYVAKKEKLDNAKKSLDNAFNLMAQAKSYGENKKYTDAVNYFKDAFGELGKSESLVSEISPTPSTAPSFEAIFALIGLSIAYLVVLRRKNLF